MMNLCRGAAAGALALTLCGCAFSDWKLQDQFMLGTTAALAVADYIQTENALDQYPRYREGNPLLGDHPSDETLLAWTALRLGLLYVMAEPLPEKYRLAVAIPMVLSGAVVYHNYVEMHD